jgi:hypothetical protein
MGIGDWGLGIGDWGLGPIPNPQSPIPNPHYPQSSFIKNLELKYIIQKNTIFLLGNKEKTFCLFE